MKELIGAGGGSLCVKLNGKASKTRQYVIAEGFGPDHRLGVFNNNTATIERAFVERYFLCKDGDKFRPALVPERRIWKSRELTLFRKEVVGGLCRLPVLTEDQVVSLYTGAKRRTYELARQTLMRRPLQPSDARLTSFVKFEKQDIGKAPRIINPRSACYNLVLGKYLKHAEKPIFKSINASFGAHTDATVIKGFNAVDSARVLRQKWDRFGDTVAVGLDATKFDMHVSIDALRYEHSFYRSLFPGCKELRRLLKWQEENAGTAYALDGKVEFSVHGTRSSGDLNTSLGNCIIMCALIRSFARQRNITIELANNGDDCVVFMENEDLVRFEYELDAWFRGHGFAMTTEPAVRRFEHIEFCQTQPIQTSNGWIMVRKHHAVFTKDPMCLVTVPNDRTYRKWLNAVGQCGAHATAGVPVQHAFYSAFERLGINASAGLIRTVFHNTSWNQKLAGLELSSTHITPEARASYYAAFGVLPDAQVAMEEAFGSATMEQLGNMIVERPNALQPGISLLQHIHHE
jgi:hypothetical protein